MGQHQSHKRQRTEQQPPWQQQQQHEQLDGAPDAASDDPSRIWLPDVVHHFASFLGGNELACTLRLVNKATAAQFRGPQHTTIQLSLQVPCHAFAWRWGGPCATRSPTVRQRRQLLCLTARSGSIANLEVLLARDDLTSRLRTKAMEAAAGAGQLEVCRWLRQQGCPWNSDAPDAAAGAGHKEVCEWLHAEGCPFGDDVVRRAAAKGRWAVCEWLLINICPELVKYMEADAAVAAARSGHVGLMDWFLARTAGTQRSLLAAAAAGCDLPTLQRLHHTYLDSRGEALSRGRQGKVVKAAAGSPTADWRDKLERLDGRGYPRNAHACRKAAQQVDGRARLEWLQQRGFPITTADVAIAAAEHSNADALEFLLAQGVQLGDDLAAAATRNAARRGHLAVLKVLRAHGARIDHSRVALAAYGGHLPVVAWLVEVLGAATALTAMVYADAARSGSAELLAWLNEAGCPWDASVFASAAISGSEEQLEWLVKRGCPMGDDGEPYRRALENADLAVLRCLRRLGCPWGPVGLTFTSAIQAFKHSTASLRKQLLLALPWLVEQGCPFNWAAAEQEARERGDGEVTAWMGQLRPPSVVGCEREKCGR
ncbi:Ankyrin repeat domain-containing protein [Tetrabaena socialis]|uniref:Ankyrin repeat domain-containing protein n=1 Tax=Tetrabaena socialis TaxID=47790 RepID=A0A2J7ZT96_9CHLO|nr:Ankyrin repeat domain-containing protein [Tetrabaena socialis]|eukprot:PNH03482.1 Ankyrin repeat domain-containing protein [Tetrabaena socialis]